jgi:hypothetical protein
MNRTSMGMGIGLGLCFGAALGVVMGDVAVGTGLGLCLGAAFASVFGAYGTASAPTKHRPDKPLPDPLGLFRRD